MHTRFRSLLSAALIAAGTLVSALPVAAETDDKQAPSPAPVQPPDKLPKPAKGDRLKNLDFLFGALKAAPDEEAAKMIEQRIWALWYVSGSSTADLLMNRVKQAVDAKDTDLALQLLDSIVTFRPEYVEAWNRRATIYFTQKEYGKALGDIRQVLAREPRHFGALAGLGMIMQELGDDKRALEVYRRTLALYPKIERIPDLVKSLQEKVEGRDI